MLLLLPGVAAVMLSAHVIFPSFLLLVVFVLVGIYTNPEAIWLEKIGFGSYVSQLESEFGGPREGAIIREDLGP